MTQEVIPQATGAAKFVLAEQLDAEEKVAETVQLAPSEVKSANEQAIGEVKGALNVWDEPQELVTVNVPEVGGLLKVTFPERVNKLSKHELGIAVRF